MTPCWPSRPRIQDFSTDEVLFCQKADGQNGIRLFPPISLSKSTALVLTFHFLQTNPSETNRDQMKPTKTNQPDQIFLVPSGSFASFFYFFVVPFILYLTFFVALKTKAVTCVQ